MRRAVWAPPAGDPRPTVLVGVAKMEYNVTRPLDWVGGCQETVMEELVMETTCGGDSPEGARGRGRG